MGTTKHAAILCLAAAAAPAAADDHAPSSLRMRELSPALTRWNPSRIGRRVAQVPPAPPAPTASSPAPTASPPAKLTEDETAKLAEDGKT
jgi:hypothetical protein